MKRIDELQQTTNSTVFGRIHRELVSKCPMCSPHKGCNRRRRSTPRNWKSQRLTKWKEKEPLDSGSFFLLYLTTKITLIPVQ